MVEACQKVGRVPSEIVFPQRREHCEGQALRFSRSGCTGRWVLGGWPRSIRERGTLREGCEREREKETERGGAYERKRVGERERESESESESESEEGEGERARDRERGPPPGTEAAEETRGGIRPHALSSLFPSSLDLSHTKAYES